MTGMAFLLLTMARRHLLQEEFITVTDGIQKSSEGESGHGIGIFKQSEAVIDGVVCNNNKVCGISPFNPGTKVTLTNSEINGNGSHGVGGRNGITISISNCNFSGNKDNGIMANDKSSHYGRLFCFRQRSAWY